ncbi:MAG: hypothetical protein M1829_005127 [Trizodia sp. TS-e1964]|nr:MAG: hypothetical protein M1829_005127 [Trizodia sp. TS-e1964]
MAAEIFQDVERCLPENDFFRKPTIQKMLLDILFIYCKLNPDIGYRQGMHELLAPFILVIESDAIDSSTVGDASLDESSLLMDMLNEKFIEHDSFTLFSLIMQNAKSFYELSSPVRKGSGGENGVQSPRASTPIVERSEQIHKGLLAKVDPELSSQLQEMEVLPQVFLIRWIRLLFGREFHFDDLLALWDLMFAEDPTLQLVNLICVAMLLRIRWQLMSADYSTALTLLLRYPSPKPPHSPSTFLHDAIYLRDNLTVSGGSHIISKYSGMAPNPHTPSEKRPPTPRIEWKGSNASYISSKRALRTKSPLSSPGKLIQKHGGLEALLQTAAKGVMEQSEKLGVNKAVRDAVEEVKRNVQGLQSSGNPTRMKSPERLGPTAKSQDLKTNKISMLDIEKRNKGLSVELTEVIEQLKECQNASSPEALASAITQLEKIKKFLEDSTLPLTDLGCRFEPSQNPEDSSHPSSYQNPEANSQAATVITKLGCSSPTPKPNSRASISSPFHQPRSSLAESSFAWMLGADNQPSGFVPSKSTEASVAESSRRFSGQVGFLFGSEGAEMAPDLRGDGDSFSLNSLK